MSNLAPNLLFLLAMYSPLMVILSGYSLHYHAATYRVSPQAVETFIKSLTFPLDVYFSYGPKDMYYHSTKYSPEQIAASSLIHRRLTSILPVAMIGASIIGLVWAVLNGSPMTVSYGLGLAILYPWFRAAWRFGRKLRDIETRIQSENSASNPE